MPSASSLFSLPWTALAPGAREKRAVFDQQVVRLLECSSGFEEPEFCTRGHTGLVLEGACSLAFRHGAVAPLAAGDALSLRPGPEDAHRLVVGEGQQVLLLLVEAR